MALKALAAAAVLFAAFLPAVPAAASSPDPTHECAGTVSRCDGTLSVPLDWSDPSSERITVAFAWLPARKRATGTILANPGGPLPALPDIPRIQQTLGPVLDDRNLLVVDPRGLGESSPLLCPGLILTEPGTIANCAARLGPRAQFFTADQAVHDMEAVRRALGIGKVDFYGNSYGTVFAQAYAARHPGSLSAAFLDSTVITSEDGYALWPIRFRPDDLDLVCERSPACRALPGRAGGTWARLVAYLRAHPDPEVPLPALRGVGQSLEPVFGREANAAATAYLSGDPEPLRRLARALPRDPGQPVEGAQWAGYLAYRCGDGAFPFERDAAPAERLAQLEHYYDKARPLAPFTPADLGLDVREGLEFCVNWPTPRPSPVLPPGTALPDVPIMVMGGDFDTQTPREVAGAMRAFPGAVFVRVPYGGHSLAWGRGKAGECVRAALRSFLTDHRVPVARCGQENYRAAGAFPRSMADVAPVPAKELSAEGRRLVAATFATAADAVARRNPYTYVHAGLTTQPGLRGGRADFHDGSVTLDRASFVPGAEVSGEIALAPGGRATASLEISPGGGRTYRVGLAWEAFTARERPALSGTFDGIPFEAPGRT
ncbi:alpha/beta fold hydrolase [Nonomuraea angiospora]|uniref:alpha/beta fold hydrolase n=1 Tax=Nonomuraea angiospora TaxID=46172 RepID=UPI0029A017CF|nr:alpha/beta fold hydrolase [Nonomuraea angiospora]MDX3103664.1 alpha/beta fold hydrolase [Nonomuraea angiospora]